jgi:hypothetical protein
MSGTTLNPNAFQAALAAFSAAGGDVNQLQHFAPSLIGQDRLVRKEVALGVIREILPPDEHIGLSLVPWLSVASDDVIFAYAKGLTDGLAPARAEDSESELAMKDDIFPGQGRASIIDWAHKTRYSASDVTRYREMNRILEQMRDTNSLPLTIGSMTEDWASKVARDTALRRRKLDNRIEWMIMTSFGTGQLAYNDGKIKFTVPWGRPAAQEAGNAANDIAGFVVDGAVDWSTTTFDPIGFILAVQEMMYDLYSVHITRAITSRRVLNRIVASDKFAQRSGLIVPGATAGSIAAADPNYVMDGWGPRAAMQVVENATNLKFIEYDSVYRTRAVGSTSVVTTRFLPQNEIIFLPDESEIAQFDDTEIGFGKMLTSPHPEGQWQSGFYEWEQERMDPWGYDVGTGVKAFPVLPHMDKTYAVNVTGVAP